MNSAREDIQTSVSNSAIIVYGAYINAGADWRELIRLQLDDLLRSGVFSVADLHVIVSNPFGVEGVASFFDELPVPIGHIEFHNENKFEYPAISHIWNLANSQADRKYIAYFHTKGMSYAKRRRNAAEKTLTYFTFLDWIRTLRIFETHANVHKIGLFPAGLEGKPKGWIWFNFWWARSSYIRSLPKPEETKDRYYYESWLSLSPSDGDGTKHHCYSILGGDDAFFTPDEALGLLRLFRWKEQYPYMWKLKNIFSSRRVWPVPDFISQAR